MVRIVFIAADGLDVAFAQLNIICLTGLIKLIGNIVGFHHLDRDGVKPLAIAVPVSRIRHKQLFISLYIGGHQVTAVVPHIFVVHPLYAFDSQFVHHALCHRIHTDICHHSIKVWFCCGTMVDQCVVVRRFDSNHLTEFGAVPCCQLICLLLRKGLGVLVIFFGSLNHLTGHRHVCRIVFIEVEHPLHAGLKVVRCQFRLFISVDIHPGDIVPQMEGPGFAAILSDPVGRNARDNVSVAVCFDQTIQHIGQILNIRLCLRI